MCQGLGARVIEITTADENDFMVELVDDDATFTSEDKAWLDCTNIGRSLNEWVCGPDDHEPSYTSKLQVRNKIFSDAVVVFLWNIPHFLLSIIWLYALL